MSLFLLTGERGVFVIHNISKNQYLTFSTVWSKSSNKGFQGTEQNKSYRKYLTINFANERYPKQSSLLLLGQCQVMCRFRIGITRGEKN